MVPKKVTSTEPGKKRIQSRRVGGKWTRVQARATGRGFELSVTARQGCDRRWLQKMTTYEKTEVSMAGGGGEAAILVAILFWPLTVVSAAATVAAASEDPKIVSVDEEVVDQRSGICASPVAGAVVQVTVGDRTITAKTNRAGRARFVVGGRAVKMARHLTVDGGRNVPPGLPIATELSSNWTLVYETPAAPGHARRAPRRLEAVAAIDRCQEQIVTWELERDLGEKTLYFDHMDEDCQRQLIRTGRIRRM